MMEQQETLLSKIYGVFTLRFNNMEDISCFIMDNLLGKDLVSIQRIYDLKGSTKGRRSDLSTGEQHCSGLKVLKDMNYIDLEQSLGILSD